MPPGRARLDDAFAHRIARGTEDDGDGRRRSLGRQRAERASERHDDVDLERRQLGRQRGEPLGVPLSVTVLDLDVAAPNIAEVTQALKEARPDAGIAARQIEREVADPSALPSRLGGGCERRHHEAEGKNDREPDPMHEHLVRVAGGSLADEG